MNSGLGPILLMEVFMIDTAVAEWIRFIYVECVAHQGRFKPSMCNLS
jgi:hypothetical protein